LVQKTSTDENKHTENLF